MNNLIKYSFRVLALTAVGFLLLHYGRLVYPAYLGFLLVIVPYLVFDLFLPSSVTKRNYSGSILEAVSVLAAMLLLDVNLFASFLLVLFFHTFRTMGFKGALLFNSLVTFILLTGIQLLGISSAAMIVVVPVIFLSMLLNRVSRENESELKAEIEAQQTQIDGKNKLLSTLAHELRTPLAVIKTSSEILLEERPGPVNEIQKRFLTGIRDNTLRMVSFADSILASIKVEYAWFRMKKKERDIRPVIKKVCNDLEPFVQSRNQTLTYSYPNLLSKTIVDSNWIQQVLMNLIHNASKHIGEKGRIVVSVNENEQCVVVSVSDDGSGIINDDKPKIFSRFYQGQDIEGLPEDNFDGVGLGLSIVKNVIEKHGGNVYVGSVSGVGTTFSFTLPKVVE